MTSLKHRTLSSFLWASFSAGTGKLIWLLAIAIIARYLGPESFGLIAIALTIMLFADAVGDLGAGSALIYFKDQFEGVAEITFALNLVMGSLWLLLAWSGADLLASLFRMPELAEILPVLGIGFLLKGLGNTHDSICQRRLDFKRRTLPELGLVSTKSVVAISLAISGHGVWSLVYAQLAGLTVWLLALWLIVPWRPRFRYQPGLLGPVFNYGKGLVAVNLLSALTHHLDVLVVGRWLGANALGFYQIAAKLPEATITMVTWVVSKVLFPAFSEHNRSGARIEQAFLVTLRYLSLFALPASVVLALLSAPMVNLVFGPDWAAATSAMQWLAIYAAIRTLSTPAGDLLKASGHTALLARLSMIKAALLLPLLWAGIRWGIEGTAVAMVASSMINLLLNYTVVSRLENIRLVKMLRSASHGLIACLYIIAASLLFHTAECCDHQLLALSAHVSILLVAYLIALYRLSPDLFELLRKTLRHES